MKTIIYISLILIALGACRSAKKTNITSAMSSTIETAHTHQQSLEEWWSLDSTDRYWYYRADSHFYWHPDVGLSSNRGFLWVRESKHQQDHARRSHDSASLHIWGSGTATMAGRTEVVQRTWAKRATVVAVLLCLLVVYILRKIAGSLPE